VRRGSWPVWNPHVSFGQPLWADAHYQVLYPPTWANLLVPVWTWYTLYAVGHVGLGAMGAFVLGRVLGLSPGAAFLSAAVWTTSGPFLSLVNLWTILAGAAWLPWIVAAAVVALRSGRPADAVLWGLAVAAPLVAASPEMTLAALAACALVAVALLVRGRKTLGRTVRRTLAMVLLAGVVALLVPAGQWLPSAALIGTSVRAAMDPRARTYWSVHPFGALQMIVPVLLDSLPLRPEWRLALLDNRYGYLQSLYCGAAAGVLAAAALLVRRRWRAVVAVAVAAAVLLALGRHTPAYQAALAILPPLRLLRFPVKAMVPAALGWALLAGMGWDAWQSGRLDGRRRWLAAGAGAAVALALAVLALIALSRPSFAPAAPRLAWTAGLTAVVVAALAATRGVPRAAPTVMAAAAVLLDGYAAHRALNPTAPTALVRYRPEVLARLPGDARRLYVYDYDLEGAARPQPDPPELRITPVVWAPWFDALAQRSSLHPFVAGVWGLGGSFDPIDLSPAPLNALTSLLRVVEGSTAHRHLLEMAAIDHVVARHDAGLEDLDRVAVVPSLYPEAIRLFRVPHPRPRAALVEGIVVAADGAAYRLLAEGEFDPTRFVLLSEGPSREPSGKPAGEVSIVEERPDRLRLRARADRPAHLVLTDAWDPQWRATVDGRATDVRRANVGFRAVALDPGSHEVTFEYDRRHIRHGLFASAAGLLLAGGVLGVGRRSGPGRASP